jgi:hypothetical protein
MQAGNQMPALIADIQRKAVHSRTTTPLAGFEKKIFLFRSEALDLAGLVVSISTSQFSDPVLLGWAFTHSFGR